MFVSQVFMKTFTVNLNFSHIPIIFRSISISVPTSLDPVKDKCRSPLMEMIDIDLSNRPSEKSLKR